MSRRPSQLVLVLAASFTLTMSVWAKSNPKDSLNTTISLRSTTAVENNQLEPGEYKVVVQGNEAKFMRDGKLIANVPCTLKTLPNKALQSESIVDKGRLTEIEVSGKTQAIEFGS